MRDGFHLSDNGEAVFADEQQQSTVAWVASKMFFDGKRCLNYKRRGLLRNASNRTRGH